MSMFLALFRTPVWRHFRQTHLRIEGRNLSSELNVTFELKEAVLELRHPQWPASLPLHSFWLRDHCHCSQCYDRRTNQRLFSPQDLSQTIRPVSITAQPHHLEIAWDDGHESCYEYSWLRENTLEGRRQLAVLPGPRPVLWDRELWQSSELTDAKVPIPAEKLKERSALLDIYQRILTYGFAFVKQVEPNMESTAKTAELVCRATKTVFGERWEMASGQMIHLDGGYTPVALRPHTDNTYFSQPVAINVFHCLVPAEKGGATTLVDGFHVAQKLKEQDPESYNILRTTPTPGQYLEPGEHFSHSGPIFQHNTLTDELEMIRWNLDDRGPLTTVRQSEMVQYYAALTRLANLIEDSAQQACFELQPGTLLFFDNWRLLHGRTAIRGRRVLAGVCFARDDFMSRAKELGLLQP